MTKNFALALAVAAMGFAAAPARADVWDLGTDNDDSSGTDNTLVHGVQQIHDLGAHGTPAAADQDFFGLASNRRSSYEVIIDGTTGDLNLGGSDLTRLAPDGTTVVQPSASTDGIDALRWENTSNTEVNFIRVGDASCGTSCTGDDQYRIRFYETTYSFPRFNNSATQFTIVNVASTASFDCAFTLHYYDGAGALLGSTASTLVGRQLKVINTSLEAFAAGQSGWIVVTHTCGYGGLTGKAVALEPATGFTFDTPLIPRIL